MSRVEAVKLYRQLHRVCQRVFQSDPTNLNIARTKIKSEFIKNKKVKDESELSDLFGFGYETVEYVSQYVVQMVQTKPDTFRLVLRDENKLVDSPPLPKHMKNTQQPQ